MINVKIECTCFKCKKENITYEGEFNNPNFQVSALTPHHVYKNQGVYIRNPIEDELIPFLAENDWFFIAFRGPMCASCYFESGIDE